MAMGGNRHSIRGDYSRVVWVNPFNNMYVSCMCISAPFYKPTKYQTKTINFRAFFRGAHSSSYTGLAATTYYVGPHGC